MASRVAQSLRAVPPETLGSQPATTGRSVGRCTIGLAPPWLGRALPVGIYLSHRAPAQPPFLGRVNWGHVFAGVSCNGSCYLLPSSWFFATWCAAGKSLLQRLSCFEHLTVRFGVSSVDSLRTVWDHHRTLTTTPSNTFGINWNADDEPGLIAQHQCLNSLMLLWMNGCNSPQKCSYI